MVINTVFDNSSAPLLTIRKVRINRLNSEVFSVDIRCISPILAYIYGVLLVDMALGIRMIDDNVAMDMLEYVCRNDLLDCVGLA